MDSKLQDLSTLRPYQYEGVKFLLERENALLADEMGLGKTVQTAVALQSLFSQKLCNRALVVCPASLCMNWEFELKRWTSNLKIRVVKGNFDDRKAIFWLPYHIYIASYETVRSDIDFIEREMIFDLVILDEAQKIKNINSSLALSCRLLNRRRAWALTGTPLENHPDDLISIFQFIKPNLLHSALSLSEIHERIKDYFLRRKKGDVLKEMPPLQVQDLVLEMSGIQRQVYSDVFFDSVSSLSENREKITSMDILAKITKLKQICNFEPWSGESCKMDALTTILEGLEGTQYKVVVFSQYVKTLLQIKVHLTNVSVSIFYGGMSADERNQVVRDFESSEGPKVLLISLKAGGVGLNLSTASLIILFDRWWNPAVEDQAMQRGHRFGRTLPLQVIRFLVEDTIEERIQRILQEKKNLFQGYVEDATVADIGTFTRADLMEIMSSDRE